MAPEDILFKTALDAIEKGERRRARDLLTRLLKADKNNPDYWVWMSAVVESSKESVFCLNEALKLDPENQYAKRGLILAGVLPVDDDLVIPYEKQRRSWEVQLFDKPSGIARFMQMPPGWRAAAGAGALVLAALLLMLVFNGIRSLDFSSRHGETAVALDLPRFVARTPTPAEQQATPTLSGPTPLWIFLESTYTPTPVYVNTPHARAESYRSAMRAYQREDYDSMLNFLQQAVAFEPDAPDLYYYLGEVNRLLEDYPAAEDAYQQALAINPEFAPALLGTALLQLSSDPEQVEKARAGILEALRQDPMYVDAYLALAEIHLQEGNASSAELLLDEVEPLAPGSALSGLLRGKADLIQGDLEGALKNALESHQRDFTLIPAYRLLGEIYLKMDNPEEALGHLSTYCLYVPEDLQAQVWLSQAHMAAGEYTLALERVNHALKVDPQYLDAIIQRGEIYMAQEAGYKAVEEFQVAVRLDPESFHASAGLGQAYWLTGLNRQAYNKLSQSLKLAVTIPERARVYYYRAQTLEALNEIVLAVRDWNALLSLQSSAVPTEWIEAAGDHLSSLSTPTRTLRPSRTHTVTPDTSPTPSPTPASD